MVDLLGLETTHLLRSLQITTPNIDQTQTDEELAQLQQFFGEDEDSLLWWKILNREPVEDECPPTVPCPAVPVVGTSPTTHTDSLTTTFNSSNHGGSPPPQPPPQPPLGSPQDSEPTSTVEENTNRRQGAPDFHSRTSKAALGRTCQICDDAASGFHYGVWSCEGCKAFFKRNLSGPADYVCPGNNQCTIDRQRRQSCKACRLRKCLDMGMYRNIRKEKSPRQPRTTSKRRSTEECESSTPNTNTNTDTDTARSLPLSPKIKREQTDDHPRPGSYIGKLLEAGPPPGVSSLQGGSTAAPIHPLVQVMMRIEPPPRIMTWHDNNRPANENTLMTSLLKLANEEIVDIINWAKSIPGYTELDLQQRIRLLESSWMEVLIVGLLWRSMPYPDTLVFTQDFRFTREMCEAANMAQAGDNLMRLAQKFSQLSVTQEEFVLLRAIILLNADVMEDTSSHSTQLRRLQQQLEQALQYTVIKRLKKDASQVSRLLLLLPHIRQASISGITHISQISNRNVVSVDMLDILKEMMQASAPAQ